EGGRSHTGHHRRGRSRRTGQALSERAGARLRRRSEPHHRGRRADRLSADARHAGRFQALRQQSQHPLRADMSATYRALAEFAQTWGLVSFVTVSPLVVVWAMWPSRKAKFEEAARMPLRED